MKIIKKRFMCGKCKTHKGIKTKVNYPFGNNSKGRLTKAICKYCGTKVV